ncbi:hypothetical protein TNCV_2158201 [Trichonephila clavipes]|nr:hypothetical protein TNCV_2158201 [Trichonephila clavipes]
MQLGTFVVSYSLRYYGSICPSESDYVTPVISTAEEGTTSLDKTIGAIVEYAPSPLYGTQQVNEHSAFCIIYISATQPFYRCGPVNV